MTSEVIGRAKNYFSLTYLCRNQAQYHVQIFRSNQEYIGASLSAIKSPIPTFLQIWK